jgi:hypothetical protein
VGADVKRRLVTQDTECYQQGIEKLVPRCGKCLSFGDECLENGGIQGYDLLVLGKNVGKGKVRPRTGHEDPEGKGVEAYVLFL